MYTAVAPLTSVFPGSGIALGFQQSNSAGKRSVGVLGNIYVCLNVPQEEEGKNESPKKKLDGEGGGRSVQNLQGRAGRVTLVWLREEKAEVGDRAMTCYQEKVILKGSGHTCSPRPMRQGRFMFQTLLL